MKIKNIFLLIIILMFPLVLTISSGLFISFNENFYKYECTKLKTDCNKSLHILSYLENKKDLDENFNGKEISHMADVKALVNMLGLTLYTLILLTIIIIVIIYYLDKKNFIKNLANYFMFGGLLGVIKIILLLLLSYLSFDFMFDLFHRLFFIPGTWLFNNNNLIINLFPETFFKDAFKVIGIIIISISAVFFMLGLVLRILLKRKQTQTI